MNKYLNRLMSLITSAAIICTIMPVNIFDVSADDPSSLINITFDEKNPDESDVFAIGDDLLNKGWAQKQTAHSVTHTVDQLSGDTNTSKVMKIYKSSSSTDSKTTGLYKAVDTDFGKGVYCLKFKAKIETLKAGNGFVVHLNKNDTGGTGATGQITMNNEFDSTDGIYFTDNKAGGYKMKTTAGQWYG